MKTLAACLIALFISQVVSLKTAEDKLVRSGYMETLLNTAWAVEQGDKIVPTLEKLLKNKAKYVKELGGATGAFPFNVYWVLAHIPTNKALLALQRQTDPSDRMIRLFAIKGHDLRERMKSMEYGVTGETQRLLQGPSEKSKLLSNLPSATEVKILKEGIVNEKEVGPRGGPTTYDYVQVLSTKMKGYLERAGDDFSPLY